MAYEIRLMMQEDLKTLKHKQSSLEEILRGTNRCSENYDSIMNKLEDTIEKIANIKNALRGLGGYER